MPLSRRVPSVTVYRTAALGSPTEQTDLEPVFAVRTRGSEPNAAVLRKQDTGSSKKPSLRGGAEVAEIEPNDIIEIVGDSDVPGVRQVWHYGAIVAPEATLSEQGEVIHFESRLDEHLFGVPVDKIRIANRNIAANDKQPIGSYTSKEIDGDTLFNPIRDAVAVPNQSVNFLAGGTGFYHHFIDPDAIDASLLATERKAAEEISYIKGSNTVTEFWTLATIVDYLLRILNPDETHVKNPDYAEIVTGLGANAHDTEMVRDLHIPVGTYLPSALDMVLVPFGFVWHVEFTHVDPPGPAGEITERKIVIFERGKRPATNALRKQDIWTVVDPNGADTVVGYDLRVDMVHGSFNHGVVLGGREEVEASFLLMPAWDPQYDVLAAQNVEYFAENSLQSFLDPGLRDAFRFWAANEGGSHNGLRPWFTQALDLSSILTGDYLVKRRRFLPTLTMDSRGDPIGGNQSVFVEYKDPEDDLWKPLRGATRESPGLTEASFQRLDNEMGIRFTGRVPAVEILELASLYGVSKLILRITATIQGDTRVRGEKDDFAKSQLQDRKTAIFDQRSQFGLRRIHVSGSVADEQNPVGKSNVTGVTDGKSDTRAAASSRATELTKKYNVTSIDGPIYIHGVDNFLANLVGQGLQAIDDIDIRFRLNPLVSGDDRYPDVVRVVFDAQRHRTRVELETIK